MSFLMFLVNLIFVVSIYKYSKLLGGDYMIQFCRDEILSRFAGIPAV